MDGRQEEGLGATEGDMEGAL